MLRRRSILFCAAGGGGGHKAPPNPFTVLGLNNNATPQQIKIAHRGLAKKYHPDNSVTGNAERFKEVQNAFDTLKEADWRYTDAQQMQQQQQQQQQGGGAGGGFDPASGQWKSTNTSYVHGNARLAAYVRIVLMWSVLFSVLRYTLSAAFPDLEGRRRAMELSRRAMQDYEAKHQQQQQQQQVAPPVLPPMPQQQQQGGEAMPQAVPISQQQQQQQQQPPTTTLPSPDEFAGNTTTMKTWGQQR